MRRRQVLATGATAISLLAGCGSSGTATQSPRTDSERGTAEPTETPRPPSTTTTTYEYTVITEPNRQTPTPTFVGGIEGTVTTEGFTAVQLAGEVDPAAGTLAVDGTVRNETGSRTIPEVAEYEVLDGAGATRATRSTEFYVEIEVLPGETFSLSHTLEFSEVDVTDISSMRVAIQTK